MKVYTTLNPETFSNIYFVTDDEQKNGVIIDPGSFSLNVYKLVQSTGAEIKKIIITHNETTQTAGIPLIKKIYKADIYAHDENILDYKSKKIKDGNIIKEGSLEFKILETPVNTYDSVSILAENTLFVGDIFQAGTLSCLSGNKKPTRYEYEIIQKHILSLPDHVIIYPGKGPATTVEIERKFNPYFQKIEDEKK